MLSSVETGVDLANVRFGRNRMLAFVGGLVFATALRVAVPQAAEATHTAAYPCSTGLGRCHCCTGCLGYDPAATCFAGGTYWYVCICGTEWKCSDWVLKATDEYCTCSQQLGFCGGGC